MCIPSLCTQNACLQVSLYACACILVLVPYYLHNDTSVSMCTLLLHVSLDYNTAYTCSSTWVKYLMACRESNTYVAHSPKMNTAGKKSQGIRLSRFPSAQDKVINKDIELLYACHTMLANVFALAFMHS
jgi:hypothetical protein